MAQDACLYIITQCGDLEKNFDDDALSRMIYLRTRMNMMKQISINSKVRVVSTIKYFQKSEDRSTKGNRRDSDLVLPDISQDVETQVIENLSSAEHTNSIIEYLSNLLEMGYDRDSAINKTATTLGVDKETMLEAMKEELVKRGKVKKTDKGEFVIGD